METKKYTTIVFDCDGTLLNSLNDLYVSTNYALKQSGYPQRTLDEVRRFVGNGVKLLMERAVPAGTSPEDFEKCYACFKQHYAKNCGTTTRPYDGIMEMLQALSEKGYKLALVSNKPDGQVQTLNSDFFSRFIPVAIGEQEDKGIHKKPAPDMVEEALRRLHSTKAEAVYVGDSDVDVATGKNSGLDCISVLWGFRDKAFLLEHGATVFIEQPMDILNLV